MKVKLIKVNGEYLLNPSIVGTKLSLKNCQAIERGYDLDELAKRHHKLAYIQAYNPDIAPYVEADYKAGFQKAVEILGDRRFTEEDMMNCWNEALTFKIHKKTFREFIQSIQQTEWDVEIEMEMYDDPDFVLDLNKEMRVTPKILHRPKLDADGCLILKRVTN